jgi:hypothetical protein
MVAGEIESPQHNRGRAILIGVPPVTIGYLLAPAVSLSGAGSTSAWRRGYFVDVGRNPGGPMLGFVAVAGVWPTY